MATKTRAAPRERLLGAANKLFYDEGIHTVGIDRVLAKAGVAKASLYSTFGSKEELVRSYLDARLVARKQRVAEAIALHTTPRARILAIFELQAQLFLDPGFRGCAFLRASAEGPTDKSVQAVCDDSRTWLRSTFAGLAAEAGAREPDHLARQLVLLYDGAAVSGQLDRDGKAAKAAGEVAAMLIDAATRKRG